MINIDPERYGYDKEYQMMIDGMLSSTDLEKIMWTIPEDIKKKIVDIYNFMATHNESKIVLQFESGIKMACEIDDAEWKKSMIERRLK